MIENGKSYLFDYPGEFVTLPDYTAHRGMTATVVRPCTADEAEVSEEMEPMYVIRFADGFEGVAWESELVS